MFDPEIMASGALLGLENFRNLSAQERQALTQGEIKVNVLIGDKWACKMPWRLFEAMSTRAGDVDKGEQTVYKLRLPAGLSGKPFLYILDWIVDISRTKNFYLLKRRDSITEDVSISRAARLLGMMEYAQHIFNHYWALFKNTTPSFDDISAVEQLALTEDKVGLVNHDAGVFLGCISKRLAHQVYRQKVADKKALHDYLQKHQKLMAMVAESLSMITLEANLKTSPTIRKAPEPVHGNPASQPGSINQTPIPANPVSVVQKTYGSAVKSPPSAEVPGTRGMMSPLHQPQGLEPSNATNWNYGAAKTSARPESLPKSFSSILKEGDQTSTPTGLAYKPSLKRMSAGSASQFQTGASRHMKSQSNVSSTEKMSAIQSPWRNKTATEQNGAASNPSSQNQDNAKKANLGDEKEQQPKDNQGLLMVEAAKKLFPKPANTQLPQVWAIQHAFTLRDQNALFREEMKEARMNPNFQFSNPTWKYTAHAFIQKELHGNTVTIGHGSNQGPRDNGNPWNVNGNVNGKGGANRPSIIGVIGDRG